MKWFSVLAVLGLGGSICILEGQGNAEQFRRMEASGDTAGVRSALARTAEAEPGNAAALTAYAEFLERYGDPASRDVYRKLLPVVQRSGDKSRTGVVAGRLLSLDLLAGDRDAAAKDVEIYRTATGKDFTLAADSAAQTALGAPAPIPGPLRSFARMAAIASDSRPEDILPALARNVVTNGYQASHSNEALEQTEYLKLVHRYISQARELDKLTGDTKVIKIEKCESPQVAELLRILGFRMRGGCGAEVVLETVNAPRAFLTTDSGFPVNQLEQALRTNQPFTYDFHPTMVPVLFGPEYWMGTVKEKDPADFLEIFLSDPSLCRLYLGLSKLDRSTAEDMRKAVPFTRLKTYSHVLDFFGGMFQIRNGKAVVPGDARAAGAWGDLVGVSPDKGTEFFDKLLAKDDGWLCSLYDAIARIHGPLVDYLTDPSRMKRFYTAVKGRITSPGPARPVFRSNTDMMLLTTRMRLDPDGKPHIPGSLDVWKTLFVNHPQGKYDGKLTKLATTWKDPDDVIEALFALCRKTVENEPLKIFMALSDLDRTRSKPLEAATIDRLARSYHELGSQFPILNEGGVLTDHSILQFLDAAEAMNKLRDPAFKSDVAGSFESLVGLWQILVRQGSMPSSEADGVFSSIVASFTGLKNNRELFDASRDGVRKLIAAVPSSGAPGPNERLIALMAGPGEPANSEVREQLSGEIERILEAQRVVSLDTLFDLADNFEAVSKGEKVNTALIVKLASRISEIPLPRTALTPAEQNAMGYGFWTEKHIDAERKLNIRSAVEKAGSDGEKLKDIRGQLAPLLRDTLLAFNYAYYAPPGAQILYTNPLFVRSHDFAGMPSNPNIWRPTELYGTGWPANAGGRLVGSLSTLPYALAEAEQNFLIPAQTQALIWGDLVPQMILDAKIPRWWTVTPSQIHWVGLHLRYGREMLAMASVDPSLRETVMNAFGMAAAPVRTAEISRLLAHGSVREAVERVTPSELFAVARDLAARHSQDNSCIAAELRQMADSGSKEISYAAISHAFGTPKPTLANSYQPELLNLRTFPALMGYSSRIMAESWESNTLFFVALADELSLPPGQLNVRIPEWTRKLVEEIFASHLEDWPALLKSLRQVGDEVRSQARAADQKGAPL